MTSETWRRPTDDDADDDDEDVDVLFGSGTLRFSRPSPTDLPLSAYTSVLIGWSDRPPRRSHTDGSTGGRVASATRQQPAVDEYSAGSRATSDQASGSDRRSRPPVVVPLTLSSTT